MLQEFARRLAAGRSPTWQPVRYDEGMPPTESRSPVLIGLAPVYADSAKVLVLGSMPGARSLQTQAYYAHPRNAFWPMMEALFGIARELDYDQRLEQLRRNGIALWDVIGRCRRSGSLDQKVEPGSIVANDIERLLRECPEIERVAFNGRLAQKSFERYVLPGLPERYACIRRVGLPSTSPAHAALSFEQKSAAWRSALVGSAD